ncbi:uncharacterized protein [Rutidosis leptorrhynchoides]|uniref:uncharacterized protein n=1 Tax=Rutidosis leptorrhynchoides TaxID=125765 RepID=UPI003A9A3326
MSLHRNTSETTASVVVETVTHQQTEATYTPPPIGSINCRFSETHQMLLTNTSVNENVYVNFSETPTTTLETRQQQPLLNEPAKVIVEESTIATKAKRKRFQNEGTRNVDKKQKQETPTVKESIPKSNA